MKYKTDIYIADGTYLQGTVIATYSELLKLFGQPRKFADSKCQVEWSIRFEDNTEATVYDWKEDVPASEVREWHIGGKGLKAVWRVEEAIDALRANDAVQVAASKIN